MRMINSGIRGDAQIFKQHISRTGSYSPMPRVHEENDFNEVASLELSNLMAATEIESNPHSSEDLVAVSNWKQMRLRNSIKPTNAGNSTSNCWAMCCQRDIRRQSEIF